MECWVAWFVCLFVLISRARNQNTYPNISPLSHSFIHSFGKDVLNAYCVPPGIQNPKTFLSIALKVLCRKSCPLFIQNLEGFSMVVSVHHLKSTRNITFYHKIPEHRLILLGKQ